MRNSSVVDMYCGVGGMTHGFVQEGFDVVAGIDVDSTCKYAFEKNNNGAKFIEKDLELMTADEITKLYPEYNIKILVGCAPCQPFSKYTNRKTQDSKWTLVRTFAELIKGVRPEVVSMENVPQLEEHRVFEDFVKTLEEEGYHIWHRLVDCVDYGVPQKRTRLVVLASKLGKIKIIRKTHYPKRHRTVAKAIGRMKPIVAGETCSKDPIHRSSSLTKLNLRRIENTPLGGSWKDWPEDLVLDCHKKESGKSYVSIYGRMRWDEPSPTMTTQCNGLGNGRFGHPEQNRAISLREAALLQTFPRKYRFVAPKQPVIIKNIARHIGNAVPVRLGRIIARSIKRHLENHNGSPS